MRTVLSANMCGARVWVVLASLQLLLISAGAARHHRRSMATQATLPVSKGGWRPVVGSGGLVYAGSYGGTQLHSPAYKLPIPLDVYQSSSRPLVARDSSKLTSIAQSYRPTTLRTVNTAQPPPANQPISSYHNPFYSNGLTYKYVQNFPVESVLIRNPQNPYAARPVFKYPGKIKQSLQNTVLQQLTNVQPIQFGQFQTSKPLEYAKPVEGYVRPDNKHGQHSVEMFKPEVFKLPDSETAPQQVSAHQVKQQQHQQQSQQKQQQIQHQQHQQQQQPVKTAQQQQAQAATQKAPQHQQQQQHQHQQQHSQQQQHQQQHQQQQQQQQHHQQHQQQSNNPFAHYSYQDSVFPPSILGTFGSFGLQSVKGRDPIYPSKTTYLAPQPTKQTIFNSFSYTPTFRTTPTIQWQTTTPKLQPTVNHIQFGSTFSDYKTVPTQPTKPASSVKIDPNANKGSSFKASPQDPFIKNYHSDYNKVSVTTYNPVQTTLASNHYDYSFPPQPSPQAQKYYDQQPQSNYNYQKKKQKIHHDSIAAGVNQGSQQYASPPKSRPTYEVFETTDSEDIITQSSPGGWNLQSYDSNPKTTEQTVTKQLYPDTGFSKQTTTPVADFTEEYAIVTEAEKGYGNSLGYDSEVESQSRRPLGDDFEPIGKHKLKDYYYKVSTPAYDDYTSTKRTKKPSESSRLTTPPEVSTFNINKDTLDDVTLTPLPTLPPTQHFKRPTTTEATTIDKDKIRKRNKNRRRRPPLATTNRDGPSTRKYHTSTTEIPQTTSSEEYHTIRPRIRPAKLKQQPNLTTPSVTTDLTTSAVPTISPTAPTIIKKKLVRRPLTTTSERIETTTTQSFKDYDGSKDSSIMKIATRPFPKLTGSGDIPDYSHKQDEKDTPTSDVSVSLSDTVKTTAQAEEASKSFAFHKDVKPIEAKLETTTSSYGSTDVTDSTTTNRNSDTTSSSNVGKVQRPRLKNKYNRTRFSVKDYRNRLSSTTSTTERSTESTPKIRFPHRKTTTENNGESETTTERKKFTPKDPRHKVGNGGELNDETEIHSIRHRQRQTTVTESTEPTTQKISSRIRNGQRRPKPTEETPETTSPTTPHSKRPLRKKLPDSDIGESVQNISVTETTVNYDHKNDITSERTRSESAIMKIADKKHHDHHIEHIFEHSKRVSDLTLAASKDYNTPGMFKTVSSNSRRIPNYFTIATDDPILPIEAFFPQLNQKKES